MSNSVIIGLLVALLAISLLALMRLFAKLQQAQAAQGQIKEAEVKARSDAEHALGMLQSAKETIREKEQNQQQLNEQNIVLEKQLERMKAELEAMEKNLKTWQEDKSQHMESAKAAVLKAGAELSNKLLDDHKREARAQQKEQEERIQNTTKALHERFSSVFDSVNLLQNQVKQSSETVDLVKNALLSPSGAGGLAEITLENIFKASHLIQGQDYVMQYTLSDGDGSRLRPDAVVFLPGDNVMVVDSKASKFYLEMQQAIEAGEDENIWHQKLRKTMQDHIRDLTKRDYKTAMEEHIISQMPERKIGHMDIVMFLPSDEALAKLRQIDKEFTKIAWKKRILPVGPSTLLSLLLQAHLMIGHSKQQDNAEAIMVEVQDLLKHIARLYDLSSSMGKGIKTTCDKYDKFAASFNKYFLSKAKKLNQLGIDSNKRDLLKQLPRYQVVASNDLIELEATAEEEENLLSVAGDSNGA